MIHLFIVFIFYFLIKHSSDIMSRAVETLANVFGVAVLCICFHNTLQLVPLRKLFLFISNNYYIILYIK